MEWSKVDIPAPTNRPDEKRPVNWLQFDGMFLRAGLIASLAVSVGWALTVLLTLGYFQRTIMNAGEFNEAQPISASLMFLVVPLYGIWMASRALRDPDDVLAIIALLPLHLLAIPGSAMIAVDSTSYALTVGALASLLGNLAYVALIWAENRAWAVG